MCGQAHYVARSMVNHLPGQGSLGPEVRVALVDNLGVPLGSEAPEHLAELGEVGGRGVADIRLLHDCSVRNLWQTVVRHVHWCRPNAVHA